VEPTPTTVKKSLFPVTVILTGFVIPIPLVKPPIDVVTPETLN
jgi:hypothetical protein